MNKVESIKELREKCGFQEDQPTWRLRIYKKYDVYLTRALLHTNITANQVTLFMFLFGMLAVGFFMMGGYLYNLLALFFLHISFFLDGSDGAIARYRGTSSPKGLFYDLVQHVIVNPLLILAIGVGAYFNNPLPIPNNLFLIFGIIGMYGLLLGNVIELKKYEAYIQMKDYEGLKNIQGKIKKRKKRKELREFFRMTVFNSFFFFGIFNLLYLLVFIYGVIIPIEFVKKLRFN